MLKIIRKCALTGCLAGILLLGGCSDAAMNGGSLLRPPRATGDKAAIQDIIAAEAGGSYSLKYPQKGENRSAIILRNENTDHEYALALYATENDTKLNVSIITYRADQNKWECIGTYANTGSGVDRVMFSDINGDKREEIIIGWTAYNSAQKSLTAYSFKSDEVYEMTVDTTYDELIVADITDDQSDDLILLSLSTQETPSVATLLQYSEQDKRPVGTYSLELDSDVISFANIVSGVVAVDTGMTLSTSSGERTGTAQSSSGENSQYAAVADTSESLPEVSAELSDELSFTDEDSDPAHESTSDNSHEDPPDERSAGNQVPVINVTPKNASRQRMRHGILVDGKRSDGTFCTQMIYFDVEKDELTDPINPSYDKTPAGQHINPTGRSEAVFSRDINGDGVLDIPIVSQMNASVDESGTAVCNQVSWNNYDAGEKKMVLALYTVMNVKDGYYVCLPDRWNGKVTARSDAETRELSFYLWNTQTSSLGDKLLTIYRFSEQQWEGEEQNTYILLDIHVEKSKAVLAARLFTTNADDSLNLSADEIQTLVFAI